MGVPSKVYVDRQGTDEIYSSLSIAQSEGRSAGGAGLLTLESGSVWPAAFLHAAHNNYDQAVFGLITRGDNRMCFVSETGLLTILCAWILATLLYIRMKKRGKCL